MNHFTQFVFSLCDCQIVLPFECYWSKHFGISVAAFTPEQAFPLTMVAYGHFIDQLTSSSVGFGSLTAYDFIK